LIAITGIEEHLLKIGQAVAQQLVKKWLAARKARGRRGRDLADLVDNHVPSRRKIETALLGVEDRVAERLAPTLARAAHGLPDNDLTAAMDAVADALAEAGLSDTALFDTNLDPATLADHILRSIRIPGLSERATAVYEVALHQACILLTHLVRELPEFNSATAVETLNRTSASLAKLDELLARVPIRTLDAPTGTDLDATFRRRYLDTVAREYDRLDIIGLTTHHYEPKTTLSVAYLSLSVADDTRPALTKPDWSFLGGGEPAYRSDNLRVEAALADSQRALIRGEAGAGKSTLLAWLAINAARGTFTGRLTEWNGLTPFLVKLRNYADGRLPRGDALIGELTCGPIPSEWVHRQLKAGTALLLVDGVDELSSGQRDKVRTWLRGQLGQYPELRVVVTSRPTAVTPKWLATEGFRSVVLEQMTPADVQVFLRRWHSALLDSLTDPTLLPCRPDEVAEHERTLLAQLQARAHLRALARSPLLCAMLCALNLDRRAKLPRDRLALYTDALAMLLERRDSDRGVATGVQATTGEKLVLLRALAWWLNENGSSQMTRQQALDRLRDRLPGMAGVHETPEALLDHLIQRSGVIRQLALGKIDFIHRTFQEFLAAKEAVDRDSIGLLVQKARSDQWRETILMACAHANAEQRGRLLTGILDLADGADRKTARQLRLLAAACQETATLIEPATVISRIDSAIRYLLPPRDVRESRSLATVGETVLDHLPRDLTGLSHAKAAACYRTAALVNGPRALELLTEYARDPRRHVQREAIDAWRYFDPEQYARRVLADAQLIDTFYQITIDFPAAAEYLGLLRNLKRCRVDIDDQSESVRRAVSATSRLNLEALSVFSVQQPDLTELSRMRSLKNLHLDLDGRPSRLDCLSALSDLTYLALTGARSVESFEFLSSLTSLDELSLFGVPVARWFTSAAKLPRLETLRLTIYDDDDLILIGQSSLRMHITAYNINIQWHRLLTLQVNQLILCDCTGIDLNFVVRLTSLKQLHLYRLKSVDLSPLADSNILIFVDDTSEVLGVEKLGRGIRWAGPVAKSLRARQLGR